MLHGCNRGEAGTFPMLWLVRADICSPDIKGAGMGLKDLGPGCPGCCTEASLSKQHPEGLQGGLPR